MKAALNISTPTIELDSQYYRYVWLDCCWRQRSSTNELTATTSKYHNRLHSPTFARRHDDTSTFIAIAHIDTLH